MQHYLKLIKFNLPLLKSEITRHKILFNITQRKVFVSRTDKALQSRTEKSNIYKNRRLASGLLSQAQAMHGHLFNRGKRKLIEKHN